MSSSGTFSESCLKSCGSSAVIWMPVTVGFSAAMRWMISLLTEVPRLWPMKCSAEPNRAPPVFRFRSASEAYKASAAASLKPASLMSDSLFQSDTSTTALPA